MNSSRSTSQTAKPSIFSNIQGDIFGGLTAGIVALPLALAFGEQTDLGAIAGLYGAIAIGFFASLFGGTNTQISGPTAPMTVVSAVVIGDAIATTGSLETALPIILATFVMAGFIEMLLGVFRLGTYIRYIPYPVVSGFMSGIGVIIILTQIFPLFGVTAPSGGPLGTLRSIHKIPEIVNYPSILLAAITILIIYLFPKLTKKIPSTLFALVTVSIAGYFLFSPDSILRINSSGEIQAGLPHIHTDFLSTFSNFKYLLLSLEYAVTLAFLGAIDSLLTSVVADNMTKTKHNSNKELIGQGIGNMAAAFIGGLPGAGATMRTVININSGGKTRIAGMIASIFLLGVLLGLGSLVGHVPNAVLAGILMTVGIGIIDYKGLKHLKDVPKTDAFVMVAVLSLTVFVDLLVAVAAGMLLSAILFMKRVAEIVEEKTFAEPLGDLAKETPWLDEKGLAEEIGEKIFIKHLDGPLFFGFATRFQDLARSLGDAKAVIIRMDKVPYIDQTGLYALEDALLEFKVQNIEVAFVGMNSSVLDMLTRIKIVPELITNDRLFENFKDCARWLDQTYGQVLHGNIKPQSAQSQTEMTPEKALEYLISGNERFVRSRQFERDLKDQVIKTSDGQFPFAAILSCIDSRMPIEKIFDQGIGDIFNARIAGNFINEDILGSLEFACKLAGSKLIVVMGHTGCGAVKGACADAKLGNLTQLLGKIKPAVKMVSERFKRNPDAEDLEFVNSVSAQNVRNALNDILQNSPVLKEMVDKHEIKIVGAMYNIEDGLVQFFDTEQSFIKQFSGSDLSQGARN